MVKALEKNRDELAIDEIHAGPMVELLFADPRTDARTPDLVIQPHAGVIYTKPSATKLAEHGGMAEDDRHVALVVSNPWLDEGRVRSPVGTTQVASTILRALGVDPGFLAAVAAEGTPELPDLF